ncbi:hypothetical protein HYU21_00035 [Candidatus Woesearchaeota archaeon]|nr:hypothetical protein [Candidatus Woesearchaeota archaeon]
MSLAIQDKLHLKKFIRDLQSHKAAHTEFVSVYIPQGYDLTKIINHLAEEQGTASNIKSASTRKNVQSALEKMIQHLRTIQKTPPNGLAVFSGNVASMEGKQDLRVWSIEPPAPLNIRIYRCDKNFVVDILEEMMAEHRVYGLVVLDRRDANIALLRGKTIIPLQKTHSEVPGKFKAGGQCIGKDTAVVLSNGNSKKIEKLKEGELVLSYDFKNKTFIYSPCTAIWKVTKKSKEVVTIVAGDSSITASLDHTFFVNIKNKVKEIPVRQLKWSDTLFKVKHEKIVLTKIKTIKENIKTNKNSNVDLIDISVKNQNFIANGVIVHNSAQRFARIREGAYKDHFKKIAEYMKDQFLSLGNNLQGIIIGGPGTTVNDFLNEDALTGDLKRKILGTKDLSYTGDDGLHELLNKCEDLLAEEEIAQEKKIMLRFFEQMRDDMTKIVYGEKETMRAMEMNAIDLLLLSESLPEDKIFDLEEQARKGNSTVKIISIETREGVQLRDLGGIAGILRFPIGPGDN